VHDRRSDAIKPRAPIRRAGRCEGGTRYNFGEETVRALLGRVLFGQGIRQRRRGELIAEAGLVLQRDEIRTGRRKLFSRSAAVLRRIHYAAHDALFVSFLSRQHASADLIELERFEQGLEVTARAGD
jgi:hypothetical protein